MCYKLNFIETCLKFFVRAFKRRHTHTGVGQGGYRRVTRGIQGVRVFVEDIFCLFWVIVAIQTEQAGRQAPPSVARPQQLNLIPNCQFSVQKRQQQQQHRQQHCVFSASETKTGVERGRGGRVCPLCNYKAKNQTKFSI